MHIFVKSSLKKIMHDYPNRKVLEYVWEVEPRREVAFVASVFTPWSSVWWCSSLVKRISFIFLSFFAFSANWRLCTGGGRGGGCAFGNNEPCDDTIGTGRGSAFASADEHSSTWLGKVARLDCKCRGNSERRRLPRPTTTFRGRPSPSTSTSFAVGALSLQW